MVWAMGTAFTRLKNASGAFWGVVLLAGLAQGCSAPPASEPMAPPSLVTLSESQEHDMTAALVSASQGSPPPSQPLDLYPTNGIRWSDLRRAMDKAATDTELAVVRDEVIDQDHQLFTLVSVQGWPAVVHVTRLDASPWIEATVQMGPSPTMPGMRQRASRLQASFLKWMNTFGGMPRVPSIY